MPDQTHSAPVRASLAILVLLLAYTISIAARTGLADVYAEPAKTFLETKSDAGEALTAEEWQAVYDTVSRALILAPGDPQNLSELGRLHLMRLESDELDAQQILELGGLAAGYYAAALALRPTWPWDWCNLALVMFERYQETHGIYHEALVRTVEFGPREPLLQELVSELGFDTWEALSPIARLAVSTALDRGLEREAPSLLEVSDPATVWSPICAEVDDSLEFLERHCDRLGFRN